MEACSCPDAQRVMDVCRTISEYDDTGDLPDDPTQAI